MRQVNISQKYLGGHVYLFSGADLSVVSAQPLVISKVSSYCVNVLCTSDACVRAACAAASERVCHILAHTYATYDNNINDKQNKYLAAPK